MQWNQLLSLKKYKTPERKRNEEDEKRVAFEVDYDRILFSSEFRSLQDKTQIIPLSKTDFVHTRLTHSMEVSVVGRSMGRTIGQIILDRYPELKEKSYQINDFGCIIASAALAHDIGNPPFGHGGEKAIGDFFANGEGKIFKHELTDKQYQDLCDFEGNANGFRILTQIREGIKGGFRITYATLGAFTKYPKESLPKKLDDKVFNKKYGFFQSEKEQFVDIATELGLSATNQNSQYISYCRHPLAFLVEAADDLCYSIIDFEDGVNLGIISEKEAVEYLMPLAEVNINFDNFNALKHREDKVSYLRALVISTLIKDLSDVFLDAEKDILNGKFSTSLLEQSRYYQNVEQIVSICRERIYKSSDVIIKEIAGYNMLKTLLGAFTMAFYRTQKGEVTYYDKLVQNLIPPKYKSTNDDNNNLYENLILISSFVAGLSDGRVVHLYNQFSKII